MQFLKAFLVGGILCTIAQILIDKTSIKSSRILVIYVCAGCFLGALGLYEPLIKFAGAGATVPLSGFGYSLSKGVINEINEIGALGILTGGLKATSAGISAAIVFALLTSIFFSPKKYK